MGHMFNSTDNWTILNTLHVIGNPSKAPSIEAVFWHLPKLRWFKVNTDGAAPGAFGYGYVFRNSHDFVTSYFAFPCSQVSLTRLKFVELSQQLS